MARSRRSHSERSPRQTQELTSAGSTERMSSIGAFGHSIALSIDHCLLRWVRSHRFRKVRSNAPQGRSFRIRP
jgi:hypothetical protein